MAVARGNAGTVSFNAGLSPTYTLPTNSTDDIMVLAVWQTGASSGNSTPTVSGWTQIATVVSATNFTRLTLFWKRSTGSESTASVSIFTTGTVGVKAWTYSGCLTSGSPIDGTPGTGTALSTTASAASTTPSNNNGMVVFVTVDGDNSSWSAQANTDPGTLSEWTDENSNAGDDSSIALADGLQTTAGATGAATATKTKLSDYHCEVQFVLQEQSAGAAATVSVSNAAVLTLAPQGPTIQAASPSTTEVSSPAVLTLTAPGPTVQSGSSVFSDPATLVFSPQGPTVRTGASVIPVDPAAIVLAAPGPTLESGASIFSDPAGLLLSAPGPTVTIVVGGTPATVEVEGPAVLQYVVPGPTIRRGASVLSDIAQLVFRVEWPTLQAGASVFGDVAGILINVLNPTVQAGASVPVSSPASLLFAGQGATIRTGASVFSGTPSLRLSAPPPTVQVGSSVFAGPQTLVITANGPTVQIVGGQVDVDVSDPVSFTLVPGDPTVVAGAIGITKKFGVNLGISVGRESVRDPTRDVGNEGISDWSED